MQFGERGIPIILPADTTIEDPNLEAEAGSMLYGRKTIEGVCWYCHGGGAVSGGAAPDLRASAVVLHAETFERIVRDGALTAAGMPGFPDLTDRELESLRHYVRRQAEAGLAQERQAGLPDT